MNDDIVINYVLYTFHKKLPTDSCKLYRYYIPLHTVLERYNNKIECIHNNR